MKKIPILIFSILFLASCRSHKTTEQSNYMATDSCIAHTELQTHSLTEIEQTESISSSLSQDHLEFYDTIGEILILSNGEVSIKGIRSADLAMQDVHRQTATQITASDSLIETSRIESGTAVTDSVKTKTDIPTSSLNWTKILLFIAITLVIFLTIRYSLNRKTP